MAGREENKWIFLAARLLAGMTFLILGMTKFGNPLLFAKEIHVYAILPAEPQHLLNLSALLLPWFEVSCGILLILGVYIESASLITGAMTAVFTLAVFYRTMVIYFTQDISLWTIEFDCGCGTGVVIAWEKILSNTALLLICFWLFRAKSRFLCLENTISRNR